MLFAENAAQGGDVLCEIVLLDDRVRPDRRHEFVFFDDRAGTLYEMMQNIECLRHQGNCVVVLPKKQTFIGIETKSFKLVNLSLAAVHSASHKFSQNLIGIL